MHRFLIEYPLFQSVWRWFAEHTVELWMCTTTLCSCSCVDNIFLCECTILVHPFNTLPPLLSRRQGENNVKTMFAVIQWICCCLHKCQRNVLPFSHENAQVFALPLIFKTCQYSSWKIDAQRTHCHPKHLCLWHGTGCFLSKIWTQWIRQWQILVYMPLSIPKFVFKMRY